MQNKETRAAGMIHFLVHDTADNVGVAVVDIPLNADCVGRNLSNNESLRSHSQEMIPLGHKIALKDFSVGDSVTKYGCEIGRIVQPVKAGHHVHTHNLKTKRWA
jgi:(2R)-sulfolactate sulfo-lyase subunit alpha